MRISFELLFVLCLGTIQASSQPLDLESSLYKRSPSGGPGASKCNALRLGRANSGERLIRADEPSSFLTYGSNNAFEDQFDENYDEEIGQYIQKDTEHQVEITADVNALLGTPGLIPTEVKEAVVEGGFYPTTSEDAELQTPHGQASRILKLVQDVAEGIELKIPADVKDWLVNSYRNDYEIAIFELRQLLKQSQVRPIKTGLENSLKSDKDVETVKRLAMNAIVAISHIRIRYHQLCDELYGN